MNANDVGATISGVGKRNRGGHLAAECRIGRLKLVDFNNQLIRHQSDESAVIGVGMRGRLAAACRLNVNDTRVLPPSRAWKEWTCAVMPSGTFHLAIAAGSRSRR